VRIEDTDSSRKVEGALEDILDSLRWLGIEWDEGPEKGGEFAPYFQSERLSTYQEVAKRLLEMDKAYKCICSPERLDEMREYQRINKLPTGYDRRCRTMPAAEIEAEIAGGKPFVIRLAMPAEGRIRFQDAVRGTVEYDAATIDDQVLLKADGWPTYHLANVVDDHREGITHVIRGEEWISSTPKHVALYEAMGWTPPIFAHAPVIKGPDGTKLSKRHGDTRCLDYREKGYLGEAVANFIALIGWSPGGDREVMTMEEMASLFSIQGIQPSPGVFDIQKLQWLNGLYIRALTPSDLFERVKHYDENTSDEEYLDSSARAAFRRAISNPEYVTRALVLEQERVRLLSEFAPACEFFFVDEVEIDSEAREKWFSQPYVSALYRHLMESLPSAGELSTEACERLIGDVADALGLEKRAQAIHPTRVALSGKTTGPGLFDLMSLLGPERMRRRLARASEMIG
jgi:glutamyl-tRNA synthetase